MDKHVTAACFFHLILKITIEAGLC